MLPVMNFPVFPIANEALVQGVPSIPLGFPHDVALLALIPIGFAAGLAFVLATAMRANRRARRHAAGPGVPVETPA